MKIIPQIFCIMYYKPTLYACMLNVIVIKLTRKRNLRDVHNVASWLPNISTLRPRIWAYPSVHDTLS